MSATSLQDRAAGALMGAFIGDALALGPHWYYDLDELRAAYGNWISDYTAPKPGRYHAGLKAGQSSQAGLILLLTLRSLVECGGYDAADFCRRLDTELFPLLDGVPMHGPGGYTSQSIRAAWYKRVVQGLPWGEVAGDADTTEAAERCLAIAVRYACNAVQLAAHVRANTALTQSDGVVQAMTTAYGLILGLLINGHPLDGSIADKLMQGVKRGKLPFFAVTSGNLQAPEEGQPYVATGNLFASPDALLGPGFIAQAAKDATIRIEPAWKVSLVYGMPCAIYHQFPAAYYLAARFADDFESAVLYAVNGGGQNQARAILTGALAGAQVGLSAIPQRFIDGLERHEEMLDFAKRLAQQIA